MATMKIKKGDMVKVIAGKDKNKEGKVLAVNNKACTAIGTVHKDNMNIFFEIRIQSIFIAIRLRVNFPSITFTVTKRLKKTEKPQELRRKK